MALDNEQSQQRGHYGSSALRPRGGVRQNVGTLRECHFTTVTRRTRLAIGLSAGIVALVVVSGVLVRAYSEYVNTPHYSRRALAIDKYVLLDERQLQISVHTGAQDIVEEPDVREDSDRVTISAWVSEYNPGSGFKNLARYDYEKTVTLKAPLGARVVVDGATGKPIPN